MGEFHGVLQGDDVDGLGVVDLVQTAAREVDFPLPVAPVTRMIPFFSSAIL